MPIEYQETSKDLLKRIDIHKKYGGKDIDAWSLELLKPLSTGSTPKILDIGCGAGKQCFLYYDVCEGKADVTGGDMSAELLARAEAENQRRNSKIKFMALDFNARLPFDSNQFDLVSSGFALYYASDYDFTISEIHRVLKPGGRMFCTGPMPGNKQLFYDVIAEASQKPIPPMPGSPRYESGVVATMRKVFASVDLHIFENPLTFKEVGPFLEYTRASLSEDRKIWKSLFSGPTEFEALMQSIEAVAKKRLAKDGSLVMTKLVGGALAVKAHAQPTEHRAQ